MTPPQPQSLGPVLHSFFASHLITVKGLRPASVRSYRDTVRLFLEGVPTNVTANQISLLQSVGGENDGVSRQLGRFVQSVAPLRQDAKVPRRLAGLWRRHSQFRPDLRPRDDGGRPAGFRA